VIAFNAMRPPGLVQNAPWTPLSDRINVPLPAEITVPLKFWIIASPYSKGQQEALDSIATTDAIWQKWRNIAIALIDRRS
jgi:hypothetical protein